MRTGSTQPLTPEMEAEIRALEALPDDQIDTSDTPVATDFSKGVRGAFWRPVKVSLTIRLDGDLVEHFKGENPEGYQTRINAALREYVESH